MRCDQMAQGQHRAISGVSGRVIKTCFGFRLFLFLLHPPSYSQAYEHLLSLLIHHCPSLMALEFHGKYQLASTHDSTITCVAFSGKGDYIASGGLDWKLLIFSSADGQLHYSVTTPSPIKSLIWLPGSEQVLVCACHNGILINVTILAGVRPPPCFRVGVLTLPYWRLQ